MRKMGWRMPAAGTSRMKKWGCDAEGRSACFGSGRGSCLGESRRNVEIKARDKVSPRKYKNQKQKVIVQS